MNIQITEIFRYAAALIAGGLIGYAFGTIQQMAGVQIDGIVSVNLKGFTSLVDNLP